MNRTLCTFFLFVCVSMCAEENDYRFIVIGDRTGGCVAGVFSDIIDEVSLLDPDFVICVGDLIHGYTDDTLALYAQWDTLIAIVEKLPCPFYFVAGNHDISQLADREIYEKRTGFKRYYSFDHKDDHFIVLDNTMTYWNSPQEMDEEQLDWLEIDLRMAKKAKNIFVFYHLPTYLYALNQGGPEPLMGLFEHYGVRIVFTGHHHTYSYLAHNGVEFINVGSSGGVMEDMDFGRGHFYHYLHISVRGSENSIALIQKDNVFKRNVITADDLLVVERVDADAVNIEHFLAREGGENITQRIGVVVNNFGPGSLHGNIPWDVDTTRYSIIPDEIALDIESEQQKEYLASITLKNGSDIFPIPRFRFMFPYSYSRSCTVTGYLPVKRIKSVQRISEPPFIDGNLTDAIWKSVLPITQFATYDGLPDPPVESTEVYVCHDEDNLYIAVRCYESVLDSICANATEHDGGTPWDDNMWFFFDPNNDQKTYYQMIVNSNGVIFDRECTIVEGESIKDLTWNGIWKAKSGKEQNAWTLEIILPKGGFLSHNGLQWGFNFRRLQTRVNDAAYWTLPFGHAPEYFGLLEFE